VSLQYEFVEQKMKKRFVEAETEKGFQKIQVFTDGDLIKGKLNVKANKSFAHIGIKLSFIGEIVAIYDRGEHSQFLIQDLTLASPGNLDIETNYEFDFPHVKLEHDSYNGVNAKLRYYFKFSVLRSYAADIIKEDEIWISNFGIAPTENASVKMEVGIEDCLHIEFEYERTNYHLQDIVLGRIYFLLVRLKIKYMEIVLIRRETTGSSPNLIHENTNITKYEIMDGAPVKGNIIPIRLFLGAFPLTPTYKNINNKFSVKYALNMVLVDEEDRRYFKQTDVYLWRERPENLLSTTKGSLTLDYTPYYPAQDEKKKKKKKKKEKKNEEEDEDD